jgi:hypothetical protein
MDMFTKTKQGIVIALIVCLLSIGLAGTLYVLVQQKIEAVASLQEEVRVAKRDDLVSLKRAIRAFAVHKETFETVFVQEKDVFSFIDALEALGEHLGAKTVAQQVLVEDISVDGTASLGQTLDDAQRSHGRLTLTLRLDGSWESIMNFLLALEQLPRATTITGARFSSIYEPTTKAVSWGALFELVTIIE